MTSSRSDFEGLAVAEWVGYPRILNRILMMSRHDSAGELCWRKMMSRFSLDLSLNRLRCFKSLRVGLDGA